MASENILDRQKRSTKLGSQDASIGLANAPLKKKISFFSSIIIVIGAVMGAGIFFKAKTVLENSQGSILFSIFCWLLTVFAIVLMAMAIIEIASARNDNLSLIGWCQTFNSRIVYKACKNFMTFVYIPLTYFFLPLYFIQSIQSGIATLTSNGVAHIGPLDYEWLITTFIVCGIAAYFIVVCGLSSRIGNIQNWIITSLNFIPVVLAIIFGFMGAGVLGGIAGGQAGVNAGLISKPVFDPIKFLPSGTETNNLLYTFQKMTPGFGLFIGMGAIFFAYDGFYITAGIQSEMKEPKKTPYALLYGLLIITVIYLSVAIAMSVGSTDGSPKGLEWIFKKYNVQWLYSVFQILIGVGVLSIINGFGLWSSRFYEGLIKANELPLSTKFINKLNSHRPVVGVVYSLIVCVTMVFIFCVVGANAYVNTGGYGGLVGTGENQILAMSDKLTRMYSFGDLMGTWASVGAFTFILFPIIGALRNRRTNEVRVEKSKLLIPSAIGSIPLMVLPIFMTYFAPIADLFLMFRIPANGDYGNVNFQDDILIPRIMIVVVLIAIIAIVFLPTIINNYILIKKYGSIDKGDGHYWAEIAKIKNVTIEKVIFDQLKTSKRYKLNEWEKEVFKKDHLSEKEVEEILSHGY